MNPTQFMLFQLGLGEVSRCRILSRYLNHHRIDINNDRSIDNNPIWDQHAPYKYDEHVTNEG